MSSSKDGVTWTTPQLVAKAANAGDQLSNLAIGTAGDGGGFATYIVNGTGGEGVGQVAVNAFGSFQGTGQPGLGALPGGGLGTPDGDVFATAACVDAKFGAVHIKGTGSCWARDTSDPTGTRLVSLGEINLNGLRIVPDLGAKIVIDVKHHKIDTFGKVRVILRAPGFGDVTIWHEALHIELKGNVDGVGDILADFPTGVRAPGRAQGLPVQGQDLGRARG